MNKTNSEKYGLPPEIIEKRTLADNVFKEVYDFYRLVKVSKVANRYERYNNKLDEKQKRKLREPLKVNEKVLNLAERIKKKTHLAFYLKALLKIFLFSIKKKFLQLENII